MAKAYYNLVRNIVGNSSTGGSYAPREFKQAMAMINNTRFNNYSQNDSQIAASEILRALHEDLNAVKG